MGPYGWGKNHSVIDWLFAEGYRFDFFQAVRLLEIFYSPEKSAQDEGVELDTKAMLPRRAQGSATTHSAVPHSEKVEDFVRFKSAVALNFPTSDISDVRFKDVPRERELEMAAAGDAEIYLTEMEVNLMGLAGALGPLDMPTTELIIERISKKDKGLKDFLDIFNHRLISLLYRIRKMHRIGFEDEPPGQDKISKYLFSIIGLGLDSSEGLRGRMMVRDRSLLHYTGLLSQQPRSIVGLERILSDYFKIKVKGHQFVGAWYDLDEQQWTRIGEVSGQNHVLGQGAVVVGTRVWDRQAKIEIRLGPLSYRQFLNFIPTGRGYRALSDLTRFYLGDTIGVSFRLVLKGEEIPLPMLGMMDEPRLGWTAWLTSNTDTTRPAWASAPPPPWLKSLPSRLRIAQPNDSQVEIERIVPNFVFKSEKLPLFFDLPPAELQELISRMRVLMCDKFAVVMNQGERGDSMFAIRRGSVRLTRHEENGKETSLGILRAGECFGEMSLLLGKHREATVTALEKCEILELGKSDFEEFAAHNSTWRRSLKAYRYGQFVKQRG
jgi:type VI secretion system protein ImpH